MRRNSERQVCVRRDLEIPDEVQKIPFDDIKNLKKQLKKFQNKESDIDGKIIMDFASSWFEDNNYKQENVYLTPKGSTASKKT